MDGILLIDKPAGWTSFDVVAKVRGTIKAATAGRPGAPKRPKVGHTGTLDPLATGLLILVLGSYCKRAGEFSKLDKVYEAEVTIGATSSTDDGEGDLTSGSDRQPTEAEITEVLNSFLGEQMQVPPAFSAIKIDGQRAYKAARAGQAPKMEPRPVTIYAITEVEYAYPKLNFAVKVSSGTYIRSLARDLGEKLDTGAYLSGLRRTQVGEYDISQATTVDDPQLLTERKLN